MRAAARGVAEGRSGLPLAAPCAHSPRPPSPRRARPPADASELAKLTFSKKEPTRITLWRRRAGAAAAGGGSGGGGEELVHRSYRLARAEEFKDAIVGVIASVSA